MLSNDASRGMNLGLDGYRTVNVFIIGAPESLGAIAVKLSPTATLEDLFISLQQQLNTDLLFTRCFMSDGREVFSVQILLGSETLYASTGADFTPFISDMQISGYELKEVLGEGGFGKVYRAERTNSTGSAVNFQSKNKISEQVAIKMVMKKNFRTLQDADRVLVEAQAVLALQHAHVIHVSEVVDRPDAICFLMELATGGDLRERVAEEALSEIEARRLFGQILKAVVYCHSKGIVHNDIKLENILLDAQGNAKVCDFGLSSIMVNSAHDSPGGTVPYLAPEVYNGSASRSKSQQSHHPHGTNNNNNDGNAQIGLEKGRDVANDVGGFRARADKINLMLKGDVWALGVLLYAMTQGQLPFDAPTPSNLIKVEQKKLKFPNKNTSPALIKLIYSMLTVDPVLRPPSAELCSSPWLLITPSSNSNNLPSPATTTTTANHQNNINNINNNNNNNLSVKGGSVNALNAKAAQLPHFTFQRNANNNESHQQQGVESANNANGVVKREMEEDSSNVNDRTHHTATVHNKQSTVNYEPINNNNNSNNNNNEVCTVSDLHEKDPQQQQQQQSVKQQSATFLPTIAHTTHVDNNSNNNLTNNINTNNNDDNNTGNSPIAKEAPVPNGAASSFCRSPAHRPITTTTKTMSPSRSASNLLSPKSFFSMKYLKDNKIQNKSPDQKLTTPPLPKIN